MTQIKKKKSEIFVIFYSEIRECTFFAFLEEQKPCKKVPAKKGCKKGPTLYILLEAFNKLLHKKYTENASQVLPI